jgi:hypothetical protein
MAFEPSWLVEGRWALRPRRASLSARGTRCASSLTAASTGICPGLDCWWQDRMWTQEIRRDASPRPFTVLQVKHLLPLVLPCCGSRSGFYEFTESVSGSGSKGAKWPWKKENIIFWSDKCSLLRAEGFFCGLVVLYRSLFVILDKEGNKISAVFFSSFGHQNPGFVSGSRTGSVSGSGFC